MTDTAVEELLFLVDETHAEESCVGLDCSNEAVWRAIFPCACNLPVCDPCRVAVEKYETRILRDFPWGMPMICNSCNNQWLLLQLTPFERIHNN